MSKNVYSKDLKLASSKSVADNLLKHYKKKFGNIVKYWEENRVSMQHAGVDRNIIVRNNGKVSSLKVEEKIRRKFYNDFLFELVSNDTYKAGSVKNIGWIKKNLVCDYFVFYFIENDKFFLFNWDVLKRTFEKNGPKWIEKAINEEDSFRLVYAVNKRKRKDGSSFQYCSHNLIVPANTLIEAYKETFYLK